MEQNNLDLNTISEVIMSAKKAGLYLVNVNKKQSPEQVIESMAGFLASNVECEKSDALDVAKYLVEVERSKDPVVAKFFQKV
jgi:hypothetical protein